MPTLSSDKNLLLMGASRGLGFALAEEYLKRGWRVVATERSRTTSKLRDLSGSAEDRLEIETVDINCPDQVAALRARLASRKFDMLFVNAGVKNDDWATVLVVTDVVVSGGVDSLSITARRVVGHAAPLRGSDVGPHRSPLARA